MLLQIEVLNVAHQLHAVRRHAQAFKLQLPPRLRPLLVDCPPASRKISDSSAVPSPSPSWAQPDARRTHSSSSFREWSEFTAHRL